MWLQNKSPADCSLYKKDSVAPDQSPFHMWQSVLTDATQYLSSIDVIRWLAVKQLTNINAPAVDVMLWLTLRKRREEQQHVSTSTLCLCTVVHYEREWVATFRCWALSEGHSSYTVLTWFSMIYAATSQQGVTDRWYISVLNFCSGYNSQHTTSTFKTYCGLYFFYLSHTNWVQLQ